MCKQMSMGLSSFVGEVVRPAASAAAVEAKRSGIGCYLEHVMAVMVADTLPLSPTSMPTTSSEPEADAMALKLQAVIPELNAQKGQALNLFSRCPMLL